MGRRPVIEAPDSTTVEQDPGRLEQPKLGAVALRQRRSRDDDEKLQLCRVYQGQRQGVHLGHRSDPRNKQQKTISTLIVWEIPTKAKNPELGWKILEYFGGEEGAGELAKRRDMIPANREAAKLVKANPGESPAHLALAVEAAEHGVNENISEHIQPAWAIYRPQLELVWGGQKSAEDALGSVKDQVERALAGEVWRQAVLGGRPFRTSLEKGMPLT